MQGASSTIVQTIEDLEKKIKAHEGLLAADYGVSWQEYNDGQASERLIEFMKTK